MSWKIFASNKEGSVGMSEEFNHMFFVLRAAKTALKAGMVVTIKPAPKKGKL